MSSTSSPISLQAASAASARIRELYHQLELKNHGKQWSLQEDMIGFMYDIGELGKLLMASEGRWVHQGDVPEDLAGKLSECLWWIFVLSHRTDVDIDSAFAAKIKELELNLSASLNQP